MPLIRYENLRFTKDGRKTIDQANLIIDEYREKGFSMTLRQLYYQFVGRKLIQENTLNQYKRLSEMMSKARIAGVTDWHSLHDNTRYMRDMGWMPDGEYLPFLKGSAAGWNVDMWSNQKVRPLVLIEKDALIGVIERICNELEVPYFAARGYMSQSAQWRLGMTLRQWKQDGYEPIVFHLGDHDPSGMDMTRDNEDRLWMFGGFPVQVIRLALNMDQVQLYNPPPMPAKKKDSRTGQYTDRFGVDVWELDALDPNVIEDLVEKAILEVRDQKLWDERVAERDKQRAEIVALVDTLDVKPPEPPEEPPERDVYEWRTPFDD